MTAARRFPALLIMFFSMFLLGGISSTKGIILEEIKHDIGLGLNQLGLVVFIFQWGLVIASVIAGYYTDKRGLKIMTVVGSLILCVGLLGTGSASTVLFFLGFYLIIGLGLGALTVPSVAVVPAVYPEKQGAMFNIGMGIFGVGMFAAPIILNAMFSSGLSWRMFYFGCTVFLAAFVFYVLRVRVPAVRTEKISVSAFAAMLKNSQFVWIMLFLIFYVSSEVAFLNFLPGFVQTLDLHGASSEEKKAMAATIISVFSILFTVGRLAGGYINSRLGEKKTLVLFSGLSFAIVAASKYFAGDWFYLFAAAGLFMSVLFPTATGLGTKLSETGGSALGLVYVAAGIGGAFSGWAVGSVSDSYGPSQGFNMPVAFLAVVFLIALILRFRYGLKPQPRLRPAPVHTAEPDAV